MGKDFYLISIKNLPDILSEDILIAHLYSQKEQVVQIFPRINSISILKKEPAIDTHSNDLFLYKINIDINDNHIHALNTWGPFYFRLSHHDKQVRLYEKKHENNPSEINKYHHLAHLRLRNQVSGDLYRDLNKAENRLVKEVRIRAVVALQQKERRKKQFELLKKEFI